jgi:hypothetical protein
MHADWRSVTGEIATAPLGAMPRLTNVDGGIGALWFLPDVIVSAQLF